jgi:hypothetical protein
MGQINSVSTESLHNKIMIELKELIYRYEFWTKDDICSKLSIVYFDKLIQFKQNDILDASAYIGIAKDTSVNKIELCAKIIAHYRKRIELLIDIKNSLEKTYTKIFNSMKGPVCQNVNGFVNDFFTCQKIDGIWLNEDQYQNLIKMIKRTDRYSELQTHIKNLNSSWKTYIKRLQKTVDIIKKDIDNSMNDRTFEDVVKYTRDTIDKLEKVTDIYYLLVVNFK